MRSRAHAWTRRARGGAGEAAARPPRRLREVLALPGAKLLATFQEQLASGETGRLADEVALAVRLLSEYGDRTVLFDPSAPIAEQELVARAKRQQFYTVLLADDFPRARPKVLPRVSGRYATVRRRPDRTAHRVELEDAVTAIALNGEIQAAIIRDDLPLRSDDRVPVMTTLLGANDDPVAVDRTHDWIGMRRGDPGVAAAHRSLSADRRVHRGRDG